jgi:hypothetical protein
MYSAMIGAAILARAQRRELLSREDFPRTCKIKHARHGGPSNAIFRGRGKTSIDRRFEFRRSCSCKRRTVLKQPEVAAAMGSICELLPSSSALRDEPSPPSRSAPERPTSPAGRRLSNHANTRSVLGGTSRTTSHLARSENHKVCDFRN